MVPGRGLFVAGTVVKLLFGLVHLLAVYQGNFGAPEGELEAEARRAARALTVDMGPFHTDAYQLTQLLSASYSALLLFVGVLNLRMLRPAIAFGSLRDLTIVNLVFTGVLTGLTIIYRFPPPMIIAGAAFVCFLVSLIRQGRRVNEGAAA